MSDVAETHFWPIALRPETSSSDGLVEALEERVVSLVERYRGARKTIEELRSSLEDRDERLSRLERQIRESEQLRDVLRERVARLLAQVDTLERSCAGNDGDGDGEA